MKPGQIQQTLGGYYFEKTSKNRNLPDKKGMKTVGKGEEQDPSKCR